MKENLSDLYRKRGINQEEFEDYITSLFFELKFVPMCISSAVPMPHATICSTGGTITYISPTTLDPFLTPLVYGPSPTIYTSIDRAHRDRSPSRWKSLIR